MFLPVLDVQDGYGWTYGVRFAVPNVAGSRSRVAFPLTWGGDKRAAVQFEKDFDTGPLDRVTGGPVRLPARAPVLRTRRRSAAAVGEAGARSAAEASRRGNARHRTRAVPGRRHPVRADRRRPRARHAPRSLARAQCRLRPRRLGPLAFTGAETPSVQRRPRGYAGLIGQSVLVGRVYRSASDRPLLPFLQPILGGMDNLRGSRREPPWATRSSPVPSNCGRRSPRR